MEGKVGQGLNYCYCFCVDFFCFLFLFFVVAWLKLVWCVMVLFEGFLEQGEVWVDKFYAGYACTWTWQIKV
ncbi:MAG: hypothetical protein JWR35_3901 [Marmoricola sp.]|nr:hypothetical protein [Marmoricola sp.]